jgi:hypothetical protein
MKAARLILLAVALSGCANDSRELSTQFSETPFRQLRGVELGMMGKQLQAARPAARYAPYLGLQETIPGHIVSYQFPSAMNDNPEKAVAPADRLLGVYITRNYESEEAATAAWRAAVIDVAKGRRKPDLCESFAAGGRQARWFAGKMALAIGAFPREPAAPHVVDRVIYAVSPMDGLKQPVGATKIECPTT